MGNSFHLTEDDKKTLLLLARKTLSDSFTKEPDEIFKEFLRDIQPRWILFELQPCFVSLTEHSGRLRGCIGCTETHIRLIDNVHFYTQLAAFEDPRFDPVENGEIDNLIIGISVLGPPAPLPENLAN